ncbi:MAG: hypothetical protein JW963_03025 [Anaerolineales bacterium]|nr:hypothetical protein [Anaerolineales bacterium]
MRKISNGLVALFLVGFVALVVLLVFQSQTKSSLPPSTPTALPEKSFVVNIPQKALFKNYITVTAEAASGTSCELTYIPPSGDESIMDTIANENGICSWRWKIDETKGKGMGRLIFTIDGISETHFIEIRSSF